MHFKKRTAFDSNYIQIIEIILKLCTIFLENDFFVGFQYTFQR